MPLNLDMATIPARGSLVENGQKTKTHYAIVNVKGDTVLPLTTLWKCRDYMHDVYAYHHSEGYLKFVQYGFNNRTIAGWDKEFILFTYSYRALDPATFDARIEQLNVMLEHRGLPSITYQKVEGYDPSKFPAPSAHHGTQAIVVDVAEWMKNSLMMSMLTGLLRCMVYETATENGQLDGGLEFGNQMKGVKKSEACAYRIVAEDYLWRVMGEVILASDGMCATDEGYANMIKMGISTIKDTIHNGGGLRSLLNNVRTTGFVNRYELVEGSCDDTPTECDLEIPFTVEDMNDITAPSAANFQMNDAVWAECLRRSATMMPSEIYTKIPKVTSVIEKQVKEANDAADPFLGYVVV